MPAGLVYPSLGQAQLADSASESSAEVVNTAPQVVNDLTVAAIGGDATTAVGPTSNALQPAAEVFGSLASDAASALAAEGDVHVFDASAAGSTPADFDVGTGATEGVAGDDLGDEEPFDWDAHEAVYNAKRRKDLGIDTLESRVANLERILGAKAHG